MADYIKIEKREGFDKVVRVSSKTFPGVMQNLVEIPSSQLSKDAEFESDQATFQDDYPLQSPFMPATQAIQDVLNKVFSSIFIFN